jgi:hypothetical protein
MVFVDTSSNSSVQKQAHQRQEILQEILLERLATGRRFNSVARDFAAQQIID